MTTRGTVGSLLVGTVSVMGWLMAIGSASAANIETGPGEQTALLEVPIDIFTYRPADCVPSGFLIVFHGVDRNADAYRDNAKPLADKLCLIVAAPLFDNQRFPSWRYQHGGVVYRKALQPDANWTGNLVLQLASWLRQQVIWGAARSCIGDCVVGKHRPSRCGNLPCSAG